MLITNSPDIGNLEVRVIFDLTGVSPVINLTNETTANPNVSPVPPLAPLIWVLNIYSPTGTPIYESDFTTPWKDAGSGDWTTAQITDDWPRPFGQIEWSEYRVEFQVKDTVGTIYELFKSAEICRPSGNNKNYQDTFGHIKLGVETLCERSSLYISDGSSKLYQGFTGVNQESYLAVDYPRDATGTLPAPYILTTFVTDALVPFYQNGEHEATYYSIWRYDLGDNVFIDIRYTSQEAFAIQCNIDLCPIACELATLQASVDSGSCANVADAQRKIDKISPKLLQAFIGRVNPTCGINVAKLVDEMKAIGGFTCDCNTGSSGVGTAGVSIPPFLFSVNNGGGDVVASFSVTDGNVVLNIKDKHYAFTQGTDAIQLLTTIGVNTNTVNLDINLSQLAEDIYNTTAASTTLLNLFNSLVQGGGGFELTVDGKCIFNSGACNYEFTMANIPASVTNALLIGITSSDSANSRLGLNYAFNVASIAALETYLNTLGIGTYVVTDEGGGSVKIVSNTNAFALTGLLYTPTSIDQQVLAVFTSDCTGFAARSANQIVQAIIDWLCPLGDEKIYTSEDYTICYVDPTTLVKKTEVIASGELLPTFFAALLARGCNTVDFIMSLKSVNCASIQALFTPSVDIMGANDFVLATKQGACARVYPVELGTAQMKLGIFDQDYVDAFCLLQQACGGGKICKPYTVLSVSTVLDSPSSNLLALVITFEHPEAIASNIRYARIDQGGALVWSDPVQVLPGESPYSISNVDEGQYVVGVTPVYADGRLCGEVQKTTDVCGAISSFSAVYDGTDIVVTYAATSEKVRIRVQYPNGGQSTQIELAGASPVSITPPSGITGTFSVTIQSVCNESTAWYGPVSAPSVFDITPANNSTITNNASIPLALVMVSATDGGGGSSLITSVTSLPVAAVAEFYLADGTYPTITLVSLSTSVGWTASIVTAAGTYPLTGANIFENVVVSGGTGGQIVILDSSP